MKFRCEFIPHALSGHGDPCDVLAVGQSPVISGAIIRPRPVGVLLMENEKGVDEKMLAVPVESLYPFYSKVASYKDFPEILSEQVAHFFPHYKHLERANGSRIKAAQLYNRWREPSAA